MEVEQFCSFINCQHPNIKFTLEKEHNKTVPFLDILVNSNENKIETSVYYKKTYTGFLTYHFSITPIVYKSSLVRTLVDCAFKINSSWKTFHLDLKRIKENLQRNSFPIDFIDSRVKCYFDHKIGDTKNKRSEKTPRYFELLYIGRYSDYNNKKLVKIVENLCKENVCIKLIFTPFKINTFFSSKDSVISALKSDLVYNFSCAGCNACYIGKTERHLSTKINEHLHTDKKLHIYKHLQESERCKELANADCFSILDYSNTTHQGKIKEVLYNKWRKPSPNKQIKSHNITLL